MIIKSMSRKEPTFGQLASYMASEKSDDRYDIHHHCYARNEDDIVSEFTENSELLRQRKNGNYLYHDIISITAEAGTDRTTLKECLREISLKYVEERCPRNMVYGCLHEDHAKHLHYHLMISANERGEGKRLRLNKKQFDQVKRDLEIHVLSHYPQLKQKEVMTAVSQAEKMSVKASAMKQRTGKLPQREEVAFTIREAISQTSSMDNFCFFLSERGYDFYVRGKNFGVSVTHENGKTKKYRFSTLGLHDEFQAFQDREFVKSEEESFSQARQEALQENMKTDAPEVEETAERANVDDVSVEDQENSVSADEKEREEFREQLKRHREKDDQAENDDGMSF